MFKIGEFSKLTQMSIRMLRYYDEIGIFKPERPNSLAFSVTEITHIDYDSGEIYITYIDAMDDSVILDLKPYTPSIERVEKFQAQLV